MKGGDILIRFRQNQGTGVSIPALSIHHLQKTYANGTRALKDVSFEVEQGDFFALLGPNGAGKSTLIGIISSLVNPTSGSAMVMGHDVQKSRQQAMHQLGLVPQELNINQWEKPLDILVNYAGFYGITRGEALKRAEEELHRARLFDKKEVMSRTLSGGMKRRLMIARALMTRPPLLILDEPTAGVDIEIRREMWQLMQAINENGTTVILTTHYLEEAENLCRNIAIIDRGEIVQHTSMRSLLSTLDVQGFVLDVDGYKADQLPTLAHIEWMPRDEQSIEVRMPKTADMNEVFAALTQQGITVRSMRNTANRLEELFIRLTGNERAKAQEEKQA